MPATVRILRLSRSESSRRGEWLKALRDMDATAASLLKRDRGVEVHRLLLADRDVVVKRWPLRSPLAHLRTLLRQSRADRHWRGAHWLEKHQIPTAAVHVLAIQRGTDGPRLVLVMEALPGKSVLQHLADHDLSVSAEHRVAANMARFAEVIHLAGGFNRDPKPSNHIVTSTAPSGPKVAVIDCADLRRTRPDGLERMLASMVIEAIGVGCHPRRALMMRAVCVCRTTPPHQLWRRVAAIVKAHGDPTPRVNPLSPPR